MSKLFITIAILILLTCLACFDAALAHLRVYILDGAPVVRYYLDLNPTQMGVAVLMHAVLILISAAALYLAHTEQVA